nr:retrovirus-related Pol polyprotein from transposon TNT 1-94 [Tanacetum cinerariifolium]
MFKNFNREDLEVLWAIVKDRFKKEKPMDDMGYILFRTLKTMFEHNVEDIIWKYQQGLAKIYPLTRNTLHQLWSDVRLQVDYDVEMAYDLLRFIRKQLMEGRIFRIKRLLSAVEVTAAGYSFYCWIHNYLQNSKAYIILNKHTKKVEESLNVTFDETPPPFKTSPLVDGDLDEEEAIKVTEKKNLENDIEDETLEIDEIINIKESRNRPQENVIGNLNQPLGGESWKVAMQEKLNQFIANDILELVPQPRNMTIIGTKWVFRNKFDEYDIVSRNKARTSHLEAINRIFRYIKGTTHLGLWYPKGTDIETVVYVDSDHAGDYVDQKSTSGICKFVGCCLTSWFSKKQTALAISTTEVEYVSTGKACHQAL